MPLENENMSDIRRAVNSEKKIFVLKAVSDKLEYEYNNSKYISKNIPEDEFYVKQPDSMVCKVKKIPEKPILSMENSKLLNTSKKLLPLCAASAILLLLFFIIVMISSELFKKKIMETGIWGEFFIAFLILTVLSAVTSFILKTVAVTRYKEELSSWENVKEQILQYNKEERQKTSKLIDEMQRQYEDKKMLMNKMKNERIVSEKAKAYIFDLQRAKVNKAILDTEKDLADLYSALCIKPEYRRIDIIIMLDYYISESVAENLESATEIYSKNKKDGIVAEHLSDAYEDSGRYAEAMYPFYEFIAQARVKVEELMSDNILVAQETAQKSLNTDRSELKTNVVSIEFQKIYEETKLYEYILM